MGPIGLQPRDATCHSRSDLNRIRRSNDFVQLFHEHPWLEAKMNFREAFGCRAMSRARKLIVGVREPPLNRSLSLFRLESYLAAPPRITSPGSELRTLAIP